MTERGYTIADDGKSITCRRCGRTSYNANDVANLYCAACKRFHEDECTMTSRELTMWTIYDHPSDFPNNFVARKFVIAAGVSLVTDEFIIGSSLELLRGQLERRGLVCLPRHPSDDAKILETWL